MQKLVICIISASLATLSFAQSNNSTDSNATAYAISYLGVSRQQNYYETIAVGNNAYLPFNTRIAVDTMTQQSIVPSVNCTGCQNGWFNASALNDTAIVSTNETYCGLEGIDHRWFGTCVEMNVTYCVNATLDNGLDSPICAENLTTYLAVESEGQDLGGYEGTLGLGQLTIVGYENGTFVYSEDSIARNFVMQKSIQNPYYSPQVCFDYSWNCDHGFVCEGNSSVAFGDVNCQGDNEAIVEHQTSADPVVWALEFDMIMFGHDMFYNAASNDSAPANIASGFPFIELPTSAWNQTKQYLEQARFKCYERNDTNASLCHAPGICAPYVHRLHVLNMTNTASNYSIVLSPNEYLQDDFHHDQCIALLVGSKIEQFTLGQPFFRAHKVNLHFNKTEISVYKKPDVSPRLDYNSSLFAVQNVNSSTAYGQYSGSMSIGTPYQNSSAIAISTAQPYTIVGEIDCTNCPDGFYDNLDSSTYYSTNSTFYLKVGHGVVGCYESVDTIQSWAPNGTAINDFYFCEAMAYAISLYNFTGLYGFGLTSWQNFIRNTFLGRMHGNLTYPPVATFNFNQTGGSVVIGIVDEHPDYVSPSSMNSKQWSFDVNQARLGSAVANNTDQSPVILASEFPYVAVPQNLYISFSNNLTEQGFICFRSPFLDLTNCEVQKNCSEVTSNFYDLEFDVKSRKRVYHARMTPEQYFYQVEDGVCRSLITEVDPYYADYVGMILGAPYFRTVQITFDYYTQLIGVSELANNNTLEFVQTQDMATSIFVN